MRENTGVRQRTSRRMTGQDTQFNRRDEDEIGVQDVKRMGKQLLGLQKSSKDSVLPILKNVAKLLEGSPQRKEEMKRVTVDLSKALSKSEFLKHRDKDVRLYTATCIVHVLRLHAPDTPFTDDILALIFHLISGTFKNLADPSSANFQPTLELLVVTAKIKCCLLLLDLEESDALLLEMLTVCMDTLNQDNYERIFEPMLDLLSALIDESDTITQPVLDCILGNLAPGAFDMENEEASSPVAQQFSQKLLQKSREALQPHIQKFLTQLLDGVRTDSDLAGNPSQLVLHVHKASPQIMLPVMPHLQPSLQVESEDRRLDSVDLICKLLTQDADHKLILDYPQLADAVLGRLNDRSQAVRQRVLQHAKALVVALPGRQQKEAVCTGVVLRMQDPDEKIRSSAVTAFCSIASEYPELMETKQYEVLVGRVRDRRLLVRKEAASGICKLVRAWCSQGQDIHSMSHKKLFIDFVRGLCNLTKSGDTEIATFVEDDVLKLGVFPADLGPEVTASYWSTVWQESNETGRSAIISLLRRKCELQEHVRDLLVLREEVKAEKASKMSFLVPADRQEQVNEETGHAPHSASDRLHHKLKKVSNCLKHIPRAHEVLEKIFGMKDNNIFKNLETISTSGVDFRCAYESAKELQSRIGSRGPSAELVQVLIARLCPTIVGPETLRAAIENAAESDIECKFVMDVAAAEPRLLVSCINSITKLLEGDDEMAASIAAEVLSKIGGVAFKQDGFTLSQTAIQKLEEMCSCGRPKASKSAARSLVYAVRFTQGYIRRIEKMCEHSMKALQDFNTLENHGLLVSHLKVISVGMRMNRDMLSKYAEKLYATVVNDIIPLDLSQGKSLSRRLSTREGKEPTWGNPSPDVEVKTELLKALSQALVPEDFISNPPEEAVKAAKSLANDLLDFTDIDTDSGQFDNFVWKLKTITWKEGGDANLSTGEGVVLDPLNYSEEERAAEEKRVADSSADAGWVRLAAAKCLFRLFRAYDHVFTGNEYLGLGLSCQDPLLEVRQSLLGKIRSTIIYFLNAGRTRGSMQQRAAKMGAFYALYGADPNERNVKLAFQYLKEYVASKRSTLNRVSIARASAGESGNLMYHMPEFMLPFLVYFLSHHPDYDADAVVESDGSGEALMSLFKDSVQMALESMIVPRSSQKDNEASAREIAAHAGVTLRIFRQLKFCDVLSESEDAADPEATHNAHQLCDIGIALTKRLIPKISPLPKTAPSRFSGGISLPKRCFKPRSLVGEEKRKDGSDLPLHIKTLELRDLFSIAYGSGFLAQARKRKAKITKRAPNDQVVEQKKKRIVKKKLKDMTSSDEEEDEEPHSSTPATSKGTKRQSQDEEQSDSEDAAELAKKIGQDMRSKRQKGDLGSLAELFSSSGEESV